MACNNCGCSTGAEQQPVQLAMTGPVVALTRFKNLAECGFFADELNEAGIPTQTQPQDEFNPLTNTWVTSYVLCVEEPHADPAMSFLTQRIAAQPDIDIDDDGSTESETAAAEEQFASSGSGGGWLVPLLLTTIVAAGGWWLYQDYARKATGNQLADELGRHSQQWVQKNSADRIVRQMSFDAETGQLKIAEDTEGNGDFERERTFRL